MPNEDLLSLRPDENRIPVGLPGGFFIYNAQGLEEIYFAEQNVIELFGCENIEEFRNHVGNSFHGMVHPDDLERVQNEIKTQTFSSEKQHDYVRYRIVTKQGETRYVEDFGHLLHGAAGQKYFYVYIVDVDKDEFYNSHLNSFAEAQIAAMNEGLDRLTGLMNMASFYETVQKTLDDPQQRNAADYTFLHFNIVNFKIINENFGFQQGNVLLRRLANTLSETFPNSKVARLSNDHFGVFTTTDDVVERISHVHTVMLTALEGTRVEIKAGIYRLEDSCAEVGVACDHARIACNTVKRRYDMMFGVYDVDLYERIRLQQYVIDTIDEATEKGYLQVFYQPIVRIETGKICGYEALVRWSDPTMGSLSPAQFVPTLEEFHTIDKMDCFVLRKACEDLGALIAAGEPVVPVSINLSRLDFELCDVFELAERYSEQFNIPRGMIDIEITESALNSDSDQLSVEVERFRDAGYHIWVDDFGSGYSSLNHLLNYKFDVLKLDLEFLRSYNEHPRAAELIRHIVQGALSLGVSPLQEGVETAEHLEFLREIGCVMAQGYYFARPLPLEESRSYTRERGLEWE